MGVFGRKKSNLWIREVPTRIAVAGVTKYQAGIARALVATWGEAALRAYEGDEWNLLVTLELEPSNPHDRLAIKVMCSGYLLGYVPRDHLLWGHEAIGSPRIRRADVSAIVLTYPDRGDGETLGVIIPEQSAPS